MSALFVLPSFLLSTTFWTIKVLFFSGWFLARWIAYLTWPLWATIVGLGAMCGLM